MENSFYRQNEIMKIIGKSKNYLLVMADGPYYKGFKAFREAYQGYGDQILLDCFAYGVMCGIREERARRKARKEGRK